MPRRLGSRARGVGFWGQMPWKRWGDVQRLVLGRGPGGTGTLPARGLVGARGPGGGGGALDQGPARAPDAPAPARLDGGRGARAVRPALRVQRPRARSEEHTSE